jgi:uncharacterized membrane protein
MKAKLATFLTTTCFALFYSSLAFAQPSQLPGPQPSPWDSPGHWHMWHGGWGFWWMFPMFIFFMIVVCIAILFFGHRRCGRHHHWGPWHMMDRSGGDPTFSALQLLNERYAKGEIQKAEYEEKKAAILSHGQR